MATFMIFNGDSANILPDNRPGAVSILFGSPAHQHRVFTVVCAIECRQQLPAFRREVRDVGVWNVAEYFSKIRWFNRCAGCGCRRYARRYVKPLAIGALLAGR
jgi:hypothetical protein